MPRLNQVKVKVLPTGVDEISTGIGPGSSKGSWEMIVDIYQSNIQRNKFLVVPSGTQVTGQSLGLEDAAFSSIAPFNTGFTLQPGLIGLNADKAEQDINAKGYHIFGIRVDVSIDPK